MTQKSFRLRMLFLLTMFLLSMNVLAQQITVKGKVKDSSGEGIIGANVLVKGTSNGTITDMDGNFVVTNVSPKATLVISFIGYTTRELPVNGKNVMSVVLTEDTQTLNEVMVVGYATGSKRTISGAVERVKKRI